MFPSSQEAPSQLLVLGVVQEHRQVLPQTEGTGRCGTQGEPGTGMKWGVQGHPVGMDAGDECPGWIAAHVLQFQLRLLKAHSDSFDSLM